MKNIICLLVSFVVLGSSCTMQRVAYKSEVKVTAVEGKAGQYLAEYRLSHLDPSGNELRMLASPRATVLDGQKREMSVGDDADRTTFVVQVDEEEAVTTSVTKVVVTKSGRVVWSSQQTLSFAK